MNKLVTINHMEDFVIETSFIYDFVSKGEMKSIDFINPREWSSFPLKEGAVVLFTEGNRVFLTEDLIEKAVVVIIDKNMKVSQVINQNIEGEEPVFKECTDFIVPAETIVVMSFDLDYEADGIRKFFAEQFKSGDSIKIRYKNTQLTIDEVIELSNLQSGDGPSTLRIDTKEMFTTDRDTIDISGSISLPQEDENYEISFSKYNAKGELLAVTSTKASSSTQFQWKTSVSLEEGVNYIDVAMIGEEAADTVKNIIVFRKVNSLKMSEKHIVMWVEQFVNSHSLNSVEKIEQMISTAKEAGITEFAIDVKGCEGFTAYKKATLSNAPYMDQTSDPKKQMEMEIDFLEEFIKIAHSMTMKVYASINFFVEGNIASSDYAINVPERYRHWAEVLQAPEDGGELKSVLDTTKSSMLLYVNPANEEVQDYQLKRAEEVMMNYDVDGVIMDRARYDNQYADFSDDTKSKFEVFLKSHKKELINWPADAFAIQKDGTMVLGPHYFEWIAFRSSVIQGFSDRLRALVNECSEKKDATILMAAYVGSWYELYYQNGVNWADESFEYNTRLKFPLEELYTREYAKTSYIKNLDFVMIGCYYDTKEQIEKYVTLGNILMNNKIKVIGSISLPDLKTPEELENGFEATVSNSDGTMIFDLCYTDWNVLEPAMRNIMK